MQASSIPCSSLQHVKLQSHTNLKPIFNSLFQTRSSYHLTLRRCRKSQPQLQIKPYPYTLASPASKSVRVLSSNGSSILCGISSNGYTANEGRSVREWVELVSEVISTAYPLWITLAFLLGLMRPSSFNWFTPQLNIVGLTIVMLGMGMTLTLDDLRGALSMPKEVLSGFVLQYSVMPLSGYFVSKLLNLPSHYAAGVILVGCCPGGTASNIVTYLARGNLALSVIMTAASTVSAVVMTPFLTAQLAGKYVAVDGVGLLISTLQAVLLPVLAGSFLNQYCKPLVKFVSPILPSVAVLTSATLGGSAIAKSSSAILTSGLHILLASSLLHISGFFFGYILARIIGLDASSSRTISIEVGMQNATLGIVLATRHFGDPLTVVPIAVSSVIHILYGSIIAGIWRGSVPGEMKDSNI